MYPTGPGAPLNATLLATFSQQMRADTAISAFSLKQGATVVTGVASFSGNTVRFVPSANLVANTQYTATISTAALALDGQALAMAFTWSFNTGTVVSRGPAPVSLGAAGNFVVLAKAAVSTVPPSVITGDVGVSPAAASFLTGFSLTADATNVFSTSPQVTGKLYAADFAVPTPSNLTTSVGNMENAYTDAATRPTPDRTELGAGNIGGLTLEPGLYKWTSTITVPTDVTISGGADDVWIFQTSGDLTVASATRITLGGQAKAKNIFWQIGGEVTLGSTSHFEGIILSKTAVTLATGATMNGRILAQTQIALQKATVVKPQD